MNLTSVFLMLGLTVHLDLHSSLYDVYMKMPQGLEKVPGHVLRPETSLNGLKQSAFNWNALVAKFILSQGFKVTIVDPCLYVRWLDGKITLVALYVDDFRTA